MKNKILFILLVCLFPLSANAQMLQAVAGTSGAVAASCTTSNHKALFDKIAVSILDYAYAGQGLADGKLGTQFTYTPGSSYTITQLDVEVAAATVPGNFHAGIYADSAAHIGSVVLGSTSGSVAVSTTGVKSFVLTTPKSGFVSGTPYWAVFVNDDVSAFFAVGRGSSAGNIVQADYSSVYNTDQAARITIHGCDY
jgi:hypothetical protein